MRLLDSVRCPAFQFSLTTHFWPDRRTSVPTRRIQSQQALSFRTRLRHAQLFDTGLFRLLHSCQFDAGSAPTSLCGSCLVKSARLLASLTDHLSPVPTPHRVSFQFSPTSQDISFPSASDYATRFFPLLYRLITSSLSATGPTKRVRAAPFRFPPDWSSRDWPDPC
jgi:hypothetical protein